MRLRKSIAFIGFIGSLLLLGLADAIPAPACAAASPQDRQATPAAFGTIELIRDTWGVAHVFADTDEGAMYGMGFACAQDRAFQMHYSLRIIQGRLAEVVGDRPSARRNESAVFNDRKMRTFGFYRAAQTAAKQLDDDSRAMLEAYCRGVNDFIVGHRDQLHPLFADLGLEPEPWTPADCIASFWHLGQFFAGDGTRELIQYRNSRNGADQRSVTTRDGRVITPPKPGPLWIDDDAAVVQRSDVSDEWLRRVMEFQQQHFGPPEQPAGGTEDSPKFSHAWVVGGRKTATSSAILISDPQTPVRSPSIWHESHVGGKTFNARGVGVPGCPGMIIGWNANVAWGATALGADQADLFRLTTDSAHPDQYMLDGQWRAMDVRHETIRVKDGEAEDFIIRETTFGPVITAFAFALQDEPEVALKRVPVSTLDTGTIKAMLGMMRAGKVAEFSSAISTWQFPSINLIFGDKAGDIGYWTQALVPIRAPSDTQRGAAALDGSRSENDWRGFVPHDLLPHVINPQSGWIASANHRAIGNFYPLALGLSTGSSGHTMRSWRLYELLGATERFEADDVLRMHLDTVNPARRVIVRAALHARDALKHEFSADAADALNRLEPWFKAGAHSDLNHEGAELATEINTFFRMMATPLAANFGGGESGLSRFLRDVQSRIEADPSAALSADELAFFDQVLAGAWQSAVEKYGDDPEQWNALARAAVKNNRIGTFDSLDGFGSLQPRADLRLPGLTDIDGGTIKSQAAQSYTQYVPLHDVDQALSLLPPGQSELPDDPHRASALPLWEKGELHPAPLSRAAVEKIAKTRSQLSPK